MLKERVEYMEPKKFCLSLPIEGSLPWQTCKSTGNGQDSISDLRGSASVTPNGNVASIDLEKILFKWKDPGIINGGSLHAYDETIQCGPGDGPAYTKTEKVSVNPPICAEGTIFNKKWFYTYDGFG